MKNTIVFLAFLLAALLCFSQGVKPGGDLVRVYLKGSDSSILVNAIDLIGTWRNIASTMPIVNSKVPEASIEIVNGSIVRINDDWRDDYPNKLRSCTWAVVGQSLQFRSTDFGRMTVEFEKLKDSNFFEMTINNITYRKLVNVSANAGR